MAETIYTYSIANDIMAQKSNLIRLEREIVASVISTALDYTTTTNGSLKVTFKDSLSVGDKTILDGIVQNHSGTTIVETGTVVHDKIEQISNAVTYHGENLSASPSTSDYSWRISRKITQGNMTIVDYADEGRFTQQWDARDSLFPAPEFVSQYSALFDGVNDHIDFGNNHNFNNATAFSLSFWIKANNFSAQRALWTKTSDDSNVFGWGLYHNNAGKLFLQARASAQLRSFTFNTVMTAGSWYHVTMTYSGSQNINGITCYINSVAENTPSSGGLSNTLLNTSTSKLGSRGSGFKYSGHMTEVSFWDKQLSASEVVTIYNSGTPSDLSLVSFNSNLINHYKLGDDDVLPTVSDNAGSVDGVYTNFSTVTADVFKEDTP